MFDEFKATGFPQGTHNSLIRNQIEWELRRLGKIYTVTRFSYIEDNAGGFVKDGSKTRKESILGMLINTSGNRTFGQPLITEASRKHSVTASLLVKTDNNKFFVKGETFKIYNNPKKEYRVSSCVDVNDMGIYQILTLEETDVINPQYGDQRYAINN